MKQILIFACILCGLVCSAKGIKIKYKTEIRPYSVIIERVEDIDDHTYILGKIKQQEGFSYNVSFEECFVILPDSSEKTEGILYEWNENKNVGALVKNISDNSEEKFILEFPKGVLPENGGFSLYLGTILNKNKTPLLLEGITKRKK